MSALWIGLGAVLLAAVFCLTVLYRSLVVWARIVEGIDRMTEADKARLGWPLEQGRAVQSRPLRSRVMWYGAPPGAPEDVLAEVQRYRLTLLGSYVLAMALMMIFFAWQIVFLTLPALLAVLFVRPWPRAAREAA